MTEIPRARPSSTVVLVRQGAGEPELFMVQRHPRSSFGEAYAFPGGTVDPEDARVHEYCRGVGELLANSRLGVRSGGLDYYSAGIRELFEESGVLLADVGRIAEGPAAARDALNDGSDKWDAFVTRNGLELQCDALHYISHWVTPPSLPVRYSTRFFVAALPKEQSARHCGGELTDSCWMTAHDVLEAGRTGQISLHYPTVKSLESLARHKTFEALMDWAASCVEWGVTTMLPVVIKRDGKPEVVLPGDRDYPGYTE